MPIVVERKLFATGDSLAVTLPKSWVRYFRLKPGDTVEITADDELTVRVKKACEDRDRNIDFHTDLT